MTLGDPFGLCGQVLDGQFRVDDVIGEGGFSVVYKGHHVGLDEPIAIKCLKLPGALGSAVVESFVRRFRDESRIHYRLSQGNLHIARSIASGTTMAPVTSALVPYMVLEWLEGRSLAQDFTQRRVQGLRGRTLAETVKLLDSAVDALAYAHAKGVVHRDVNPGNLFLTESRDGMKLKVLDFGVAKVVSDHALAMGPRAVTLGHIRIFAPAYASPEQFEDKIGKIGPWTDVYSITLVILEMLRDRTVNEGEHLGEFAMKTLDEVNRPTPRSLGISVGDAVEALLGRAVSMAPSERPQDAGELWGMLKNAIRIDTESGRPPHAHRPQSMPPRASALPHDTHVMQTVGSPAVEVVRPPSVTPPPVGAVSRSTRPMAQIPSSFAPGVPRPRAGASTVRMENAPVRPGGASEPPSAVSAIEEDRPPRTLRTGSAALAATPTTPPPPGVSHRPSASLPIATPAPGGIWLSPSAPPPQAYSASSAPPPYAPSAPPPAQPRSQLSAPGTPPGALADEALPRSRGPMIAIVLVVVALLIAVAIGVVLFVLPRHAPAPTPSSPNPPPSAAPSAI